MATNNKPPMDDDNSKTVPEMSPLGALAKTQPGYPVDMKTQPGYPVDMKTQPGYPVDMKTEPGNAQAYVPPPAAPAKDIHPPKGSTQPSVQPVAAAAAHPAKKLSRRRRVKLAPPPKKLDVEVAVYGENNFYSGFEHTIATGGLFVASLETLPPGHELDLDVSLEGKSLKTRGRVEWIREDNVANPECTSGAGFKLVNLSSDQTRAIESFFQRREPLFFHKR